MKVRSTLLNSIAGLPEMLKQFSLEFLYLGAFWSVAFLSGGNEINSLRKYNFITIFVALLKSRKNLTVN